MQSDFLTAITGRGYLRFKFRCWIGIIMVQYPYYLY
nr:MAG TPA: hypothetical protein [Caudoviricetes sp.]